MSVLVAEMKRNDEMYFINSTERFLPSLHFHPIYKCTVLVHCAETEKVLRLPFVRLMLTFDLTLQKRGKCPRKE